MNPSRVRVYKIMMIVLERSLESGNDFRRFMNPSSCRQHMLNDNLKQYLKRRTNYELWTMAYQYFDGVSFCHFTCSSQNQLQDFSVYCLKKYKNFLSIDLRRINFKRPHKTRKEEKENIFFNQKKRLTKLTNYF